MRLDRDTENVRSSRFNDRKRDEKWRESRSQFEAEKQKKKLLPIAGETGEIANQKSVVDVAGEEEGGGKILHNVWTILDSYERVRHHRRRIVAPS